MFGHFLKQQEEPVDIETDVRVAQIASHFWLWVSSSEVNLGNHNYFQKTQVASVIQKGSIQMDFAGIKIVMWAKK